MAEIEASAVIEELAEACRYSSDPDDADRDPELGSVDSLIAFKDALEDKVAELVADLNAEKRRRRRLASAVAFALGFNARARRRCRVYSNPGSVVRELTNAQKEAVR